MIAIHTEHLTRRFAGRTAVDSLSLDLPAAGVIGLVGPNGSGKSTLIRMLLGLIRPSDGSAWVLGEPIDQQRRIANRIGALIESPAFVPALSAHANLRSLADLRGLDPGRIDEVVATVGLTGREREPVKTFSLGMKQRLGIAAALLPDPDLLILDEPTNGLDPAGIVEIRNLLRSLGTRGRTVVVSSHMLSEIEAVCDYVVIIKCGAVLFSGPIETLMARAAATIDVAPEHPADLERLGLLLADAGWRAGLAGDGCLRLTAPSHQAPAVNRVAMAGGITLGRLTATTGSLEDLFLSLTSDDPGPNPRSHSVEPTPPPHANGADSPTISQRG